MNVFRCWRRTTIKTNPVSTPVANNAIGVTIRANDVEMIKKAGLGVSYNGKIALDKEADIHFKNTNLLGLLYAQGYSDKQIKS